MHCAYYVKISFYKYWCNVELDELKTKSIESHHLWVAAGCPMSGVLYDRKRTCKAQYRRGLSRVHATWSAASSGLRAGPASQSRVKDVRSPRCSRCEHVCRSVLPVKWQYLR